jgi:hypothetical protein
MPKPPTPSTPPPLGGTVPNPPSPGSPKAPEGWEPPKKGNVVRLRKPTKDQADLLPAVTTELQNSSTYDQDFGPDAPGLAVVLAALRFSSVWMTEVNHAEGYLPYARLQSELANDGMLGLMNDLGEQATHFLKKHSDLAEKYPSLLKWLSARSDAGKRGAETRKANKKAQKDEKPAETKK